MYDGNHMIRVDIRIFLFCKSTGKLAGEACSAWSQNSEKGQEFCAKLQRKLIASLTPSLVNLQNVLKTRHVNGSADHPPAAL